MKHQLRSHQTELVHCDEEVRRLKVRVLASRDENVSLQEKLHQRDAQAKLLNKQVARSRTELEEVKSTASSREMRLRSQDSEVATLKAQVESLNNAMQDSGKALQEKFALSRELSRLKPEMEHLQSQLSNYQAVVAEKHDLRRQLDSLEVELENEKRSKQRARSKEDNAALEELRSQRDDAERRLAADCKERDRMIKEKNQALAEATSQNERLEERLATLKSKLKATQAELKETRVELEQCRANLLKTQASSKSTEGKTKKSVVINPQPNKKRRIQELSIVDTTIGTPGIDETKRATKRRGAELVLEEKSTFSITPFLNRTKNISDDSMEPTSPIGLTINEPILEEQEEVVEELLASPNIQGSPAGLVKRTDPEPHAQAAPAAKPRGRPRIKALADSASSKKNMATVSENQAKRMVLEKVNEEPMTKDAENSKPSSGIGKELTKTFQTGELAASNVKVSISEADGKRKRRKLLGGSNKSVFDDEDGETVPRPAKLQHGAGRKLKAPLGGVANAFAGKTFSPLKRDRRGVNASFLV
ncbi:hypothetical protein S40288_08882 [Stachybotrys chartarum IBT 40288]|nr:hypothetical protein S40288_08882 [Stachybotrys chartarum IBT 40288]